MFRFEGRESSGVDGRGRNGIYSGKNLQFQDEIIQNFINILVIHFSQIKENGLVNNNEFDSSC